MEADDNRKDDDRYADFEYMDNDLHFKGRASKKSLKAINVVISISAVLGIVGGILLGCSESGSAVSVTGMIMLALAGFGIFIVPLFL